MKITALTENTSHSPDIGYEHGLSLYIETGGIRILFDAGQTDLFARNAEKLGIDLGAVDIFVLSHGHYDHGGGLAKFLEINKTTPVYMSRYAFEPHFNGEKYIGLDPALQNNKRIIFTEGTREIYPGITLFSPEGRDKKYDLGSFGLTAVKEGKTVADDFRHELFAEITENGRKILFSGCSHSGIMDIARWFNPDVLAGGFHFSKLDMDKTLADYAKILDSTGIKFITCHCTGTDRYEYMKPYMKNLGYISAGETVEII